MTQLHLASKRCGESVLRQDQPSDRKALRLSNNREWKDFGAEELEKVANVLFGYAC